jgi:hypothetical protein
VALFACSEVCGSSDSTPWLLSPRGGIMGVALSFLMSYDVSAMSDVISSKKCTFLSAL